MRAKSPLGKHRPARVAKPYPVRKRAVRAAKAHLIKKRAVRAAKTRPGMWKGVRVQLTLQEKHQATKGVKPFLESSRQGAGRP